MWRRVTPKQSKPLEGPQVYPSGVCIKVDADYWYIKGKYKWRFVSDRAVDSWGFKYIVEATADNISKYKNVGKLGFREGTLIYNIKDGKLYIISDLAKHQVTNPDVLKRLGLESKDAVVVGDNELSMHENGDDLSL